MSDLSDVNRELGVIITKLKALESEVRDLKETNKILLEFMYRVQGGKAWLAGLFVSASAIGALFSNIASHLFYK